MKRLHIGVLAVALSAVGCGLLDGLVGAINTGAERTDLILDQAISQLTNAQADWQNVLKDTVNKLTDDAQSTVRNEVNDLLQRGIASTSGELRCDADFMVNRIRNGLIRIKEELLHQPVDPLEPQLCNLVPLAIDRALVPARLNVLEIYGYDFDTTPITVLLQSTSGTTDVSHILNKPTHYHMTLTLGGSTGVQLDAASQRLILKWSGREISSIAVIQPVTPVCRTQIVQKQPSSFTFVPPHTRGDTEYNGHGPKTYAEVQLVNNGTSVVAKGYMKAEETKDDWTTAEGRWSETVFVPDPGWRVSQLLVGTQSGCASFSSCMTYTDSNHDPDIFAAGNGPVSRFEFVGDTDGDEAGTRTKVTVTYNVLKFEETETGNCVTSTAIKQLIDRNLVSPELKLQLNRLQPQPPQQPKP
jgi:hypothetical protein